MGDGHGCFLSIEPDEGGHLIGHLASGACIGIDPMTSHLGIEVLSFVAQSLKGRGHIAAHQRAVCRLADTFHALCHRGGQPDHASPGQGATDHGVDDCSPAQRDDARVVEQFGGCLRLEVTEGLLPLLGEDLGHGHALLPLEEIVDIHEVQAVSAGEQVPDRGLSDAGQSHEDDLSNGPGLLAGSWRWVAHRDSATPSPRSRRRLR